MDKKVVIGITVALLLVGAIIMVYGGAQLVSPEEKVVDASTEKTAPDEGLGFLKSTSERLHLSSKSAPGLPILPEGGNEVILGIIFIVGGILLYTRKEKKPQITS